MFVDPATSARDRNGHHAYGMPDPEIQPEYYDDILLRRSLAYLVDAIVIFLLSAVAWFFAATLTVISFGLLSPLLGLPAAIGFAYHTLLVGGPLWATLGMRLFGVEVRSHTGDPPSYLQAALLTAVFYVTVFPTSFLVLLICLMNPRRRALHDFAAGTVVLRARPEPFVVVKR